MTIKAGPRKRGLGHRSWHLAMLTIGALLVVPQVARAQFFWEQSRLSPDDAARVAMRHGFQVIERPSRNDDVYVAEVIDRRGARERLVISSDTGRILQRTYVDADRGYPTFADQDNEERPVPPGRIPQEERHPGFFARLFGNDDTDAVAARPDHAFVEPDQPVRQPRSKRQPRFVEQTPDTVHRTPVESTPLVPPSAAPTLPPHLATPRPSVIKPPAEASLPPPAAAPAPTDRPAGKGSRNPLAIPGSREQDEKAAAAAQPAHISAVPTPAKPVAPPKDPVAVAPLE